jgi:hypothetical protein
MMAPLLGGDLNPILGFCFPLFSRVFPGEFPSAWKTVEGSGRKSVVNCSQSTYIVSARFNISYTFLARGKLGITRFRACIIHFRRPAPAVCCRPWEAGLWLDRYAGHAAAACVCPYECPKSKPFRLESFDLHGMA